MKKIKSVENLSVGQVIQCEGYPELKGKVVSIEGDYVHYLSERTGLIQPIHMDSICHYFVID